MLTKTPFLTGFSTHLFGRAKSSAQAILSKTRDKLRHNGTGEISAQLATEIPPELVHQHSETQRKRFFPHEVIFWAFLSQVFSEDGSCARAVAQVQEWSRATGLPVPSAKTASYVEARKNLPEKMLESVHDGLVSQLEGNLTEDDLWRGHRVKAMDATTVQAPDTEANQSVYPQPSSQAEGCGFPVVKLVGLIDLAHGGLENFAVSDCNTGELRGLDELVSHLKPGEVLVADRLYSSYETLAHLGQRGVEFIGRYHQARKMDFRKGIKLGPDERLQVWKKPRQQPSLSRMDPEEWQKLPETITLRIIRYHGPGRDGKRTTRYAITTLIDHVKYPQEEVISLYFHRWEIELRFRDIKTTMKMELLRTRTPAMLRKEIMMHVIAYNVIRLLMLKSAKIHRCNHRRLSFKGAVQVLEECAASFRGTMQRSQVRKREKDNLFERISERIIPERPGRNEPRKLKRRPKSFGWLQQPRHEYPEHFHSDETPWKVLDEEA